ncbi:MAG: response regulator [Clostridia bacterium]|nr:response regulator [Clostridia bacterium]
MQTVLFVDDDLRILQKLQAITLNKSIQCFLAQNGEEALKIVQEHEIEVAIVDLVMPVISGEELLDMITSISPDTVIMIMTEESNMREAVRIHNELHTKKIIVKPFTLSDDIAGWIHAALSLYHKHETYTQKQEIFQKKVDKYKQILFEMRNTIRNREESYEQIVNVFGMIMKEIYLNYDKLSELESQILADYEKKILNDFIHIFLLCEFHEDFFEQMLVNQYHDPGELRYFRFRKDLNDQIKKEHLGILIFITMYMTQYFSLVFPTFVAKLNLSEENECYVLNFLYEANGILVNEETKNRMIEMVTGILNEFADRYANAAKGNVIQYKVYINKNSLKGVFHHE